MGRLLFFRLVRVVVVIGPIYKGCFVAVALLLLNRETEIPNWG